MITVYVIKDKLNRIYIGQTKDLIKRLKEHNSNKTKSLRNRGPFTIIYQETLNSRQEAVKREKSLKSGQGREWIKKNFLKSLCT